MMLILSFSWRYTLSTLLAEGAGKVSRSVAAATRFCLALVKAGRNGSSRLMAAVTSLAKARALVRSTVMTYFVSSGDLR
jgi:hypothetical protein